MMLAALLLAVTAAPVQDAVDRVMAGRQGAVVVLEAASGRLVAAYRLEVAARRLAAPGSAVKPFTLAALLESGRLKKATTLMCRREVRIAGRPLDCTHPQATAPFDPPAALAYSCTSFFVEASARLASSELAAALRRFGLASRTRLAEDEANGVVREAGSAEERALQAVGEADVLVTPLGMAAAYRKLALRRAAGDAVLAPLFEGLEAAVRFGTAQRAAVAGLDVAGKTGTASSPSGVHHAWFAGYAPASHPAHVVVVFLERGSGGGDAAPVAAAVFDALRSARSPSDGRVKVCLNWLHPSERRVKSMTLEEYVAAVLAGEAAGMREPQALRALAVASRSYAVHFRSRHRAEGFDFCDTTHCQDLRLAALDARVREAAEATEGEVLWFQGRPATTFYHQDCGGQTEDAAAVFPDSAAPYLRRLTDPYCVSRGRMEWSSEISSNDLARTFGMTAGSIRVTERTASGRVAWLDVSGRRVSAPELHFAVGRVLGWHLVRSAAYEVAASSGGFRFHGYGSGHGVGLCQHGAARMAAEGRSYREILSFYYPSTRTGVTAQGLEWTRLGGECLEVWTTQPSADAALVAQCERVLEEAERRAGLRTQGVPRIRLFPTVAAFRDATGQSGLAAGSTRGRVVRLQPPGVLRARGTLERTLLHELLHVVVETNASPRLPVWFRESVVVYLAEDRGRVKELAVRYGRATVLGWIQRGLPAEIAQ
ncbi:MAG: SpoIID/LytB domain-containing protein [Bryobacteraceae bacterium]